MEWQQKAGVAFEDWGWSHWCCFRHGQSCVCVCGCVCVFSMDLIFWILSGFTVTTAAITIGLMYAAQICSPSCCIMIRKHKQCLPLYERLQFGVWKWTTVYSIYTGDASSRLYYGSYHDVWAEIMMCGLKLWCVVWKAAWNMGPCWWQFGRKRPTLLLLSHSPYKSYQRVNC